LISNARLEPVSNLPRIRPRPKVSEVGSLSWFEGKLKPVHNLLVKRL